jgi:hypothetical protein
LASARAITNSSGVSFRMLFSSISADYNKTVKIKAKIEIKYERILYIKGYIELEKHH